MTDLDLRQSFAHIVATLTRILGPRHLALAEEAAQDALVKALQRWPYEGRPENPSAWLIQVARNGALDQLRRARWLEDRALMLADLDAAAPTVEARLRGEPGVPDDDQLAMIFLACHPALPRQARVALTLKVVCGFSVGEIARALLSTEDAVAQRLVRAKRRLREPDIQFELTAGEQAERLESALDVLYLLFNEGYAAHAGDDLIRRELCDEAIKLTAKLAQDRARVTPAVHALLALMLLQAARFDARLDDAPELQRLAEQDRARWNQGLMSEGLRQLQAAAVGTYLSVYHLEAEIAACHTIARRYEDTDWNRIVGLYNDLFARKPTPVVALNRAIAISRVDGAEAGRRELCELASDPVMKRYHLLHATLGQLALDTGDAEAAFAHFRAALECECSAPERRFLERQLAIAQQA